MVSQRPVEPDSKLAQQSECLPSNVAITAAALVGLEGGYRTSKLFPTTRISTWRASPASTTSGNPSVEGTAKVLSDEVSMHAPVRVVTRHSGT